MEPDETAVPDGITPLPGAVPVGSVVFQLPAGTIGVDAGGTGTPGVEAGGAGAAGVEAGGAGAAGVDVAGIWVERAGQLVTSGPQEVMVWSVVA